MDVHMSLFVSPIVFPLAFSINGKHCMFLLNATVIDMIDIVVYLYTSMSSFPANYQRRESVLEDLAMFKSSSSILFFCHRDWIKAAGIFMLHNC